MIRVLRLLEYMYPDGETADADMALWKQPASGVHTYGTKIIRSAIISDLNFNGYMPDQQLLNYDPDNVLLVKDRMHNVVGVATKWNPCGIGECIVQYFDGSASSELFGEILWVHNSTDARLKLNSLEL